MALIEIVDTVVRQPVSSTAGELVVWTAGITAGSALIASLVTGALQSSRAAKDRASAEATARENRQADAAQREADRDAESERRRLDREAEMQRFREGQEAMATGQRLDREQAFVDAQRALLAETFEAVTGLMEKIDAAYVPGDTWEEQWEVVADIMLAPDARRVWRGLARRSHLVWQDTLRQAIESADASEHGLWESWAYNDHTRSQVERHYARLAPLTKMIGDALRDAWHVAASHRAGEADPVSTEA